MRAVKKILIIGAMCTLGLGVAAASFLPMRFNTSFQPLHFASLPVEPVDYGNQKVVYHVGSHGHWRDRNSEAWKLVTFINNHFSAIEPDDLEVEVVFHANGIETLQRGTLDPKVGAAFDALMKRGVRFRLCAKTLQSWGLTLPELRHIRQQDLVASAPAWLVRLQRAGFGYIKL